MSHVSGTHTTFDYQSDCRTNSFYVFVYNHLNKHLTVIQIDSKCLLNFVA